MKYIPNENNLLRSAILSATGVIASAAIRRSSVTRTGGGLVRLGGAYSGQHDATIDIEVLNNTISGAPQVSAPVFAGVGNGTMTGVSADTGVAAQSVKATLIDLGTQTRKAYAPFQGVTLRAKASGTAGNLIAVTVNESGITRTPTNFALIEDLRADFNEYVGDAWDFGHAVLNPDGTIPTSAPRVSFGDDPQVYRAYKQYLEGRYVYRFSPAPVRDVQAGARVKTITGTRTVVIADGTTTNTYTSITTLYSLLSAIQGDSGALVEVVEPVTIDLAPGGMGIDEMSVRTTSYLSTLERDGTRYTKDADIALTVGGTSPTETLEIRCSNADFPGAERWAVTGTVSGPLAEATTGVAYDGANYDFLIPISLPPASEPSADKLARLDLLQRTGATIVPSLCYRDFLLGAEAQTKTFTFTWRHRPADECECDPSSVVGAPDGGILGIDDGGSAVPSIHASLTTRVNDLYQWASDFAASNSALLVETTTADTQIDTAGTNQVITEQDDTGIASTLRQRVSAVLKLDRVDINAANAAVALFAKELQALDSETSHAIPSGALTEWDDAVTDMQTEFGVIDGLSGGGVWRDFGVLFQDASATAGNDNPAFLAKHGAKLLTQAFDAYLERFRTRLRLIRVKAGYWPNFDGATRGGNDVWQDYGGDFWFESEDGLLPIQPGHYYYSSKLGENEDGDSVPIATREFGIGIAIGCEEELREGDRLTITINVSGNIRQTYQVGDAFTAQITKASPVPFGGGQTGSDQLTWRVIGSTLGALANYVLSTVSPAAYSASGVHFLITPGGVPFSLGDEFTFSIEGGQFRWRKDAGSWATLQMAPTVSLAEGLTATFEPGNAPSFVAGDTYQFKAEAINGVDNVATLRDGRLRTTGVPIEIVADMGTAKSVSGVYIGDHNLTVSATIVLEGSTVSNFASIGFTQTITPQVGADVWAEFTASSPFRYWRLRINSTDFACGWVWLGNTVVEMTTRNGSREIGRLRKKWRLPSATARMGLGVTVEHAGLRQSAVDALLDMIQSARTTEQRRVGIVCNPNEGDQNAIVAINVESVEISDVLDFMPTDAGRRFQSVSLELEPA